MMQSGDAPGCCWDAVGQLLRTVSVQTRPLLWPAVSRPLHQNQLGTSTLYHPKWLFTCTSHIKTIMLSWVWCSLEAEASRPLWVQGQPYLHSEFPDSQSYIVRPSLSQKKKKKPDISKQKWHMYSVTWVLLCVFHLPSEVPTGLSQPWGTPESL